MVYDRYELRRTLSGTFDTARALRVRVMVLGLKLRGVASMLRVDSPNLSIATRVFRIVVLIPFYLCPHHDVRNAILGVLEKMRVRTIGVKNVLAEQLAGKPLPLELFLDEGLRTKG